MSGFSELAGLGAVVRPLTEPKPPEGGRYSPFSASLTSTIDLLATELRALQAERIVIGLDLRENELRIDGLPRADARPRHDGVELAFESKFGPLRYATAEFQGRWGVPGWQANLRAIALSMEALRKVDRYGVSKRGEQYQGWKAIPRSTDAADSISTSDEAWRVVCEAAGLPSDVSPLKDGISQEAAIRRALKAVHPDTGGDPDSFRRVVRAREILERT